MFGSREFGNLIGFMFKFLALGWILLFIIGLAYCGSAIKSCAGIEFQSPIKIQKKEQE